MSSENTGLFVEITGDATGAIGAANASQESMDALTAAIGRLTESLLSQDTASDAADASLTRYAGATERAAATSDALTAHSMQLARGLDAVGLSAGGAATKATAMFDVLGRMEGVVPGLVALAAAASVAFAGFEWLKNGVKDASDFQNAMRELQIAAAAAGQSTAGMTDKVHEWAIAMEEAAGISASQTVPAVLRLVDAGQSVAGAMTIATVAAQMVEAGMGRMRGSTDMAESSQMRYNQVLLAFYQAMDGNYTAISRIDPAIRKLVEAHAPLPAIIAAINEQTKNSISLNNDNAMTWERVKGILEATGEEIGAATLPALTKLGQYIFGMIASCQNVSKAFGQMGNDIATIVGNSIDEIGRLGSAIAQMVMAFGAATSAALDFTSGNLGAVKGDIAGFNHSLGEAGKWSGQFVKGIQDIGGAFNDLGKQQATVQGSINHSVGNGNALLEKQLNLLKDTAANYGSVVNAPYKSTAKGGGGTGYNAPASAYETDTATETKAQTAAEKELTATTDALDAAKQKFAMTEAQLTIAVKLSTTALAEGNAQQALNAAKASDAKAEVAMLSAAISDESNKQKEMNSTAAAAKTNYDNLVERLDAMQRGHEGVKKTSIDAKQSMTELDAEVKQAKSHWDDATAAAQKYTEALKSHTQELEQAKAKELEAAAATDEQIAGTERSWNDFMGKQAQDSEENTAKQTLQGQKLLAFYRSLYQQDYDLYVSYMSQKNAYLTSFYEKEAEQAYQKMVQEQNTLYQTDYNNYKQNIDKMTSIATNFLDTVLTKTKSWREAMKTVWDDVLKDFLDMISKMLAAMIQSGLMQLLSRFMGSSGSGGVGGIGGMALPGFGGAGGAGGAGASIGGVGGIAPAAGAAGAALASGGAGGASSLINPASAAAAMSSIYGGASSAAGSSAAGAASSVGGSAAPAGSTLLSTPGRLGSLAMAGIGGEVIGNMIGKMLFGNATNANDSVLGSEVGGAAGGILASMLIGGMWGTVGGPIGIALGALVGALLGGGIGSLFGDHFAKANEPDIYQTQQWGQELADMQGSTSGDPMIANGQSFTMDSWTQSQTQSKGWNVLMENFVQMFRGKQKSLPQALQGGFADIEALWGGAQNTADFNDNGKNGMLQIGSGRMAEWTTFWSYISAYGPAIAQMMAMYTPTDMYAASLNGSVTGMGGYTPSGDPYLLHSFPDAGLPGGQGGMPPSVNLNQGGSKQTVVNVNNYQMFAGSSIADSNIRRSIAQNVADAIKSGFSLYNLNTV